MCFEVVDGNERLARDERDGFCRRQTDNDPTDQARTGSGSDSIELRIAHVGLLHGATNDAVQQLNVRSCSDLRHHAAVVPMLVELRMNDVRADRTLALAIAMHDRGGGLIAGGLNAKNEHSASLGRGQAAGTSRISDFRPSVWYRSNAP
jgi:hypothetical protein